MAVLGELGVKLTALLGAAGIVGIAVGFASQTSVSNIISGLFLISEKPFAIGDVIRIGTTTGIIQSIDLLSIKIRTFDNLFVRIPEREDPQLRGDEHHAVSHPAGWTSSSRWTTGRIWPRSTRSWPQIAGANPWSLDEPEPVIMFNEFKESGIEVLLGLWFAKTDFVDLKNSIMKDISRRFAAEGIRFAHPRRTVSAAPTASAAPRRRARAALGVYLLMICSRRGPTETHVMRRADVLLDEKNVVPRLRRQVLEPAHAADVGLPARQLRIDRLCLVQQPGDREGRRRRPADRVRGADRDRFLVGQHVEVRDGRFRGALDTAAVQVATQSNQPTRRGLPVVAPYSPADPPRFRSSSASSPAAR